LITQMQSTRVAAEVVLQYNVRDMFRPHARGL